LVVSDTWESAFKLTKDNSKKTEFRRAFVKEHVHAKYESVALLSYYKAPNVLATVTQVAKHERRPKKKNLVATLGKRKKKGNKFYYQQEDSVVRSRGSMAAKHDCSNAPTIHMICRECGATELTCKACMERIHRSDPGFFLMHWNKYVETF
jgi:hypothetical protein